MRMISYTAALFGLLVVASPATAQERFVLGGDVYSAGSSVALSEPAASPGPRMGLTRRIGK